MALRLNNFEFPWQWCLCQVWLKLAKESVCTYFHFSSLFIVLKRAWSFILTHLDLLYPMRMLCAKFGLNWVNYFFFRFYLLLVKGVVRHFRCIVPLISEKTPFWEFIGLPMATLSISVRNLLPGVWHSIPHSWTFLLICSLPVFLFYKSSTKNGHEHLFFYTILHKKLFIKLN